MITASNPRTQCDCGRPKRYCLCFVPFTEQMKRDRLWRGSKQYRAQLPDWLQPAGHSQVEPWTEGNRTRVRDDNSLS